MKKLIFIAILVSIFAIGDVSAQVISYSQTKITEFEKEKKPKTFQQFAGAEFGAYPMDPYAKMSLGAFYEAGAMLNKSIFVGGGVGLGYSFNNLNSLTSDEWRSVVFDYNYHITAKGIAMKAYVDAKFYLTKTKLRPYFDLVIGGIGRNVCNFYYNYDKEDDMYHLDVDGLKEWFEYDLFANPQFGLEYQLGGNVKSVFVNAGYFLPLSAPNDGRHYGKNEGFRVKLGITF